MKLPLMPLTEKTSVVILVLKYSPAEVKDKEGTEPDQLLCKSIVSFRHDDLMTLQTSHDNSGSVIISEFYHIINLACDGSWIPNSFAICIVTSILLLCYHVIVKIFYYDL